MKIKLVPLLVLLVSLCAFEVFAASGDAWMDPATLTKSTGDTFVVSVKAYPSSAVSTAYFDLIFDKDKLEVTNIDAGTSLTQASWSIGKKVYDNNAGTINFQAYSFTSPLPSQEQTLFTISFKIKATTSGSAQISIVKAEMKSGTTNYITGTKNGATITYSASVACTANDWETGSWGACSLECGGTQTRTVTKKAASASCTGEGEKPVSTQSCGSCPAGKTCSNGVCVAQCTPSCAGKQCGSDGCGGVCGTCPSGTSCDAQGMCKCVPSCTGKTCGGSCGTCAVGLTCQADGTCAAAVDNKLDAGSPEKKALLQKVLDAVNDGSKATLQKISAIAKALKDYFG